MICELCERELEKLTVHHLIPKHKKGTHGPRINICSACHKQVHALFDNTRLARELNTAELLKDEPQMQKFLVWVKKQKTDRKVQVRGRRK
ncbi:MAG: HNH endonuclease [Cyanobacteria bacterium J06635_10]